MRQLRATRTFSHLGTLHGLSAANENYRKNTDEPSLLEVLICNLSVIYFRHELSDACFYVSNYASPPHSAHIHLTDDVDVGVRRSLDKLRVFFTLRKPPYFVERAGMSQNGVVA